MKKKFNGYTYIGDGNDPNNIGLEFNNDYFQRLVSQGRYNDAADYGSQFVMDDPKIQENFKANIDELRHQGRIATALYSRITNPEQRKRIDFYDGVFAPDGLNDEKLIGNPYSDKFIDLKNKLGAANGQTPDMIEIQFAPHKQSLFSIDDPRNFFTRLIDNIGDALVKDNDCSIENFYNNIGMSKKELENAGFVINQQKDGSASIMVNPTNNLANKVIYEADKFGLTRGILGYADVSPKFIGRQILKGQNGKNNTKIIGETTANGDIAALINDAKEDYDTIFTPNGGDPKFYSSTVSVGDLFDTNPQLLDMLENGQINQSMYNQLYKQTPAGQALAAIKSSGLNEYDLYGTEGFFEDDDAANSSRLVQLDNEQRSKINALVKYAEGGDVQFKAMTTNGKLGTLITIDTANKEIGDEDNNVSYVPKNDTKQEHQFVQVFVPGLFTEQAQQLLNKDTSTRSAQEINSMIDYGYDYKTGDGKTISIANIKNAAGETEPTFMLDNNPITQADAQRFIDKDMLIDDGKQQKLAFINNNDKMTDFVAFDNMVKTWAIKAADELYPDVPLTKADGSALKDSEIFNYKTIEALGKKQKIFNGLTDTSEDVLNRLQYKKVSDIMDMYNKIMDDASPYYVNK